MGSSEARRGTKTFIRKTEAMFNFSRINWPEGELLNNSLYGLYECYHRTKTNTKKKGDICALFFRHQRLSIVKKKNLHSSLSHLCYLFWNEYCLCISRRANDQTAISYEKPQRFIRAQEYPRFYLASARSSPQWSKVSRQNGLNIPQWFGHRFPLCDKRKADENIFGFTQIKQSIIRWFSLFVLLPLSLIESFFTEWRKGFKWS